MKNNNAYIYVYAIFYAHKSRRGGGAALKIMIDFIIVLGQISIVVGGAQHKRLISKHNTHTHTHMCAGVPPIHLPPPQVISIAFSTALAWLDFSLSRSWSRSRSLSCCHRLSIYTPH